MLWCFVQERFIDYFRNTFYFAQFIFSSFFLLD